MKKYNVEKILATLDARYAAREAGTKTIVITMHEDGNQLILEPCAQRFMDEEERNKIPFSKHDWVFVGGDHIAATLGGTPQEVAKQLAQYSQLKEEYIHAAKCLWELYDENKNSTIPCHESRAYETYSDWHKEIFGYRPHGWVQPPIERPLAA